MNQKRYLGLELSGAKNAKTTLAVLEYYPKEKKIFLLDIHSGIGADHEHSSDQVLLETLKDHADDRVDLKLGVNVPLTLPPCIACTRKSCPLPDHCSVKEVKWMKTFTETTQESRINARNTSKTKAKLREFFTPYTQRPVELWIKNEVLPKLPKKTRFEMDETLGGNKAPLTARMHFLKMHLTAYETFEVLPKLTVALLMPFLELSLKTLLAHRNLEEGIAARQTIIERMSENLDIFIYDRDIKKLTQNLNAFDAFICAYTVLLMDLGECVHPPKGFPTASGWIHYPKSSLLNSSSSAMHEEEDEET